jgi:hypothetical protein
MPNPCPQWTSQSYGPVRVQLNITAPDGYEEQYVQSAIGPPYRQTSEILLAIQSAVDLEPPDATVTIVNADDPEPRVQTVSVGGGQYVVAGTPDRSPLPDPPGYTATWTIELCAYAPNPPTTDIRDYAEIGRLWTTRIHNVHTASGATLAVTATRGWFVGAGLWFPTPAGFPTSIGREISLAPLGQ